MSLQDAIDMSIKEYNPDDADHRADLARRLLHKLTRAGFRQTPDIRGFEVVMERAVKHKQVDLPDTVIRVFTTVDSRHPRIRDCPGCQDVRCTCPEHALSVRGLGEDAIRVCAVYLGSRDKHARGLTKHRRVFRTGRIDAIVDRTLERAREAWRDVLERPQCRKCGTPTFTSRGGKSVCAAICWENKR